MNSINGALEGYPVHRPNRGGRRGAVEKQLRRLIAVDIENMVGGACVHRHQVDWVKSTLSGMLSLGSQDHVVVGLSHIGLLNVGSNWPSIRYVVRSGRDGADLALLDVLNEDVNVRFDQVVIASGDGVFAQTAAHLASAGVEMTVLARRGKLARSLQNAASQVLYVPEPPAPVDVVLTDSEVERTDSWDPIEWRSERGVGSGPRDRRDASRRRPRQPSRSASARGARRASAA